MTTTRRRKAPTRSVAIRRVKQNAKRKERKTQKRKSRNKVMRGGVHENLKVYVIQKKLEKPKCFIIRQKSMPKDTIYLFFDSNLKVDEIKEFVYAAMGLDVGAVINPELISDKSTDEKFNSLFVKLSGNFSYSLSSGQLSRMGNFQLLTQETLKEHTSNIAMKNGEDIIQSLKSKMVKDDYQFMDVKMPKSFFKTTDFCKLDLYKLFNFVMEKTGEHVIMDCKSDSDFISKLDELLILNNTQLQLTEIAERRAGLRLFGKGELMETEADKQHSIDVAKKELAKRNTTYDNQRANDLIAAIKESPKYATCKIGIIDNASAYSSLGFYFDETDQARQFKSIEDIFNEEYRSRGLSV